MQLKLGLDMELSKQIPRPTRRLFIARMPQVRFKGLFKNTPLLRLALRTKFNMQLSTYQRTAQCWVLLPHLQPILGLNSIPSLPIHVVSRLFKLLMEIGKVILLQPTSNFLGIAGTFLNLEKYFPIFCLRTDKSELNLVFFSLSRWWKQS